MVSESPNQSQLFECVEIYVPKKLENLSALYSFLNGKLAEREKGLSQDVQIDGFSLYEVDGAFYGSQIYQERTMVIRILLERSDTDTSETILAKIRILGEEIAPLVAEQEEELWISHYPQHVMIFQRKGV